MVEIMPKGELDLTKMRLTPSWFITLILAVILIAAAIGIGLWGYAKVKGVVTPAKAADGAW